VRFKDLGKLPDDFDGHNVAGEQTEKLDQTDRKPPRSLPQGLCDLVHARRCCALTDPSDYPARMAAIRRSAVNICTCEFVIQCKFGNPSNPSQILRS
jgi:hypothetical protein